MEHDRTEATLQLRVDWAPAYELLISLSSFVCARIHPTLDLGPTWVRDIRQRLTAADAVSLTRNNLSVSFKDNDGDLLTLLVLACPGPRDAPAYLGWLAELTPGMAYEALAPLLPETGSKLPRDFADWRDRLLEALCVWNAVYFRQLDPAILVGLRAEADALRARLHSQPAEVLVEDVTHGVFMEASADLQCITLVPQYHERPYNHHSAQQHGVILLYPADVLPAAEHIPPAGLLRLTRGLADESRLRILRFLANGPSTLTEVARFAGLSQPTVHHHLAQLRAAGLVRVHFLLASPSRYSLRPHVLEYLSDQLCRYLTSTTPAQEALER